MKNLFINLINILDKELLLYNEMKDLYNEKKEILIKNNIEALSIIDAKIIENNESIKLIDEKRLEATKLIGEDITNMTDLILIAEKEYKEGVSSLKELQAKLLNISQQISILNMTNMKLIEHGMNLADKKLNIIIEACAPQATGYNESGKEGVQEMGMSTIVQDA